MYSQRMGKRRPGTWLGVAVVFVLCSCRTASQEAPIPESSQVISDSLAQLYMQCSTAPPHSPAQQHLVIVMADKASNGKELLMVMRADLGVFPPGDPNETRVRHTVETKMMKVGTLNQLIEYADLYPVNPEDERPFAQHIFVLAGNDQDPGTWYRVKAAEHHLKVGDLEEQAQAKGDQLRAGNAKY